jgi:hypothetical protein
MNTATPKTALNHKTKRVPSGSKTALRHSF